ncbi:hypothetical protein, conserved [Eimeria praecox]|uniref:Uncharacterized protein n=1 Tax=Eimeria praecox TaxID=51316 RepID=U6H6L2_9EIME|nr:hypothetical protein, conserved [Eimeria praecox]
MAFRGSPLGFSAALAGLPVVLMLAQPLLCLCHMKGPFTHTHAAVAYAENGGNGITGGHGEESYANSLEQAGADAHLWEATCSSYKSITVRFPEIHALATYDLKQIVQGAPPTGWACKASEPLFELDEYPPFFRTKLKTPNDPHEEIQRLLADLLKEPSSPSTTSAAQKGEEEADTTECLQNVLAANTTLLYSYRDKNKQQHPDSNGIGALWSQPEITDDPTPWEPLNTDDPFEGLVQAAGQHQQPRSTSANTRILADSTW